MWYLPVSMSRHIFIFFFFSPSVRVWSIVRPHRDSEMYVLNLVSLIPSHKMRVFYIGGGLANEKDIEFKALGWIIANAVTPNFYSIVCKFYFYIEDVIRGRSCNPIVPSRCPDELTCVTFIFNYKDINFYFKFVFV